MGKWGEGRVKGVKKGRGKRRIKGRQMGKWGKGRLRMGKRGELRVGTARGERLRVSREEG